MSGVRYSHALRRRLLAGEEPGWLQRHIRRGYIIQATLARVWWGDQKAIKKIYRDAKRRGLVVDHQIPLCHPDVCGLTVHNNLRAIPKAANAAKGNKWHPDQVEAWPMDPEPHQMRLALVGARIAC